MVRALKDRYRRAEFEPGRLGVLTNPFYFARKGLFEQVRSLAHRLEGRILDVGCGRRPYERLFRGDGYEGLEIDTARTRALGFADYFYDGTTFPFPDASFDGVVINQVLEHVFNPVEFCSEVWRVTRPGGKVLITVPFVWDEHEQPFDYARYSSFGLAHLLHQSGFRVERLEKTMSDGRVLFQLLAGMIYKRHQGKARWWRALVQVLVIAPITACGVVIGPLIRGSGDLYLDNVVLVTKEPAA